MTNKLFYGGNLDVLRNHIADGSVDLIYLDPPFNSDANYNVLFKAPAGRRSEAQIEAFKDTWTWGEAAARAFDDVIRSRHAEVAMMLRAAPSSPSRTAIPRVVVEIPSIRTSCSVAGLGWSCYRADRADRPGRGDDICWHDIRRYGCRMGYSR